MSPTRKRLRGVNSACVTRRALAWCPVLHFWLEGNVWSHGSTTAGFELSNAETSPVTRINRIVIDFRESVGGLN